MKASGENNTQIWEAWRLLFVENTKGAILLSRFLFGVLWSVKITNRKSFAAYYSKKKLGGKATSWEMTFAGGNGKLQNDRLQEGWITTLKHSLDELRIRGIFRKEPLWFSRKLEQQLTNTNSATTISLFSWNILPCGWLILPSPIFRKMLPSSEISYHIWKWHLMDSWSTIQFLINQQRLRHWVTNNNSCKFFYFNITMTVEKVQSNNSKDFFFLQGNNSPLQEAIMSSFPPWSPRTAASTLPIEGALEQQQQQRHLEEFFWILSPA